MIGVVALSAIVVACAVGVGGAEVPCDQWLQQCFTPATYVAAEAYAESGSENLYLWLRNAFKDVEARQCRVCEKYREEESFMAITKVVRSKKEPSPSELQNLVPAFCEAHSDDSRVDKAYECRTGCPLADALNQVCFQARQPSCKEPPKVPCFNTAVIEDFACGEDRNVSLGNTYEYKFDPCGYPRCPETCLFTVFIDGVNDDDLSLLSVGVRGDVYCPDSLTIYSGSVRDGDNVLFTSPCPKPGGGGFSAGFSVNYTRTITIALVKSAGGSGDGFSISSVLGV